MVCMLYYWKVGKSLRQYCLEMKYDYQCIRKYVIEYNMTMESAIKRYLSKRSRKDRNTKYYYKGKTVKDYCIEHGYSYPTARYLISNRKYIIEDAIKHCTELKRKKDAKRKEKKD